MADYSSYVTIQTTIRRAAATIPIRRRRSRPEARSHSSCTIRPEPRGSQVSVTYGSASGFSIGIGYACPYGFQSNFGNVNLNGTGFVVDWYGQSDSNSWIERVVQGSGHPVRMFVGVRLASEPQFRAPGH